MPSGEEDQLLNNSIPISEKRNRIFIRNVESIIKIFFYISLFIILIIYIHQYIQNSEKFLELFEFYVNHPVSPTKQEQFDYLVNYYCGDLPLCPGWHQILNKT